MLTGGKRPRPVGIVPSPGQRLVGFTSSHVPPWPCRFRRPLDRPRTADVSNCRQIVSNCNYLPVPGFPQGLISMCVSAIGWIFITSPIQRSVSYQSPFGFPISRAENRPVGFGETPKGNRMDERQRGARGLRNGMARHGREYPEIALDAIWVANADLDVIFVANPGVFEDRLAFREYPANAVVGFVFA